MTFVMQMNHSAFIALLRAADVVVDTFPVGGGLTVAEALLVGTPVITVPEAQVCASCLAAIVTVVCGSRLPPRVLRFELGSPVCVRQ